MDMAQPKWNTDYTSVMKLFRSGSKTARTRMFPGADAGIDHDMVIITFQTCIDLKKLNDPTVMSDF